jgi:hypothetical protein
MELTKEKAKELAIAKWQWIVEHNFEFEGSRIFDEFHKVKEFKNLISGCAYCSFYGYNNKSIAELRRCKKEKYIDCTKCPIAPPDIEMFEIGCLYQNHPFNMYIDSIDSVSERIKIANELLELIKNSPEK